MGQLVGTPSRTCADPCRPAVPGCAQGYVARISSRILLKAKTCGTVDPRVLPPSERASLRTAPRPHAIAARHKENNKNHIYIRLRRGGARSREEQEDQGGAPCLNDVGLLGGVGANTSAIFGDRSESAELRDAQTIARVGIEGCVGFSRTVSTKPCNTSRSSLPARASPTGEGGLSEADLSNKQRSSKLREVIRGRKVDGFDRPTVWARSRPFPLL